MAEGGERTEGRLGVQAVCRLTCMLLISKGETEVRVVVREGSLEEREGDRSSGTALRFDCAHVWLPSLYSNGKHMTA